jgi:hypothetical protein
LRPAIDFLQSPANSSPGTLRGFFRAGYARLMAEWGAQGK